MKEKRNANKIKHRVLEKGRRVGARKALKYNPPQKTKRMED